MRAGVMPSRSEWQGAAAAELTDCTRVCVRVCVTERENVQTRQVRFYQVHVHICTIFFFGN